MKQTILFTILLIGIIFTGCGEATKPAESNKENTNSTETKPDNTASSPEKKEEEKSTVSIKPEDIDMEKPFEAGELNSAVLADVDAWKGKEVAITGKYHSTTKSQIEGKDRIRIDISDAKTNKKVAGCVVEKEPPEELSKQREGRVFKGKVLEERYGRVLLEPCEFVK